MSVPIGIDFRGSSGYVTDPANCTYCLADVYPTLRVNTLGWDPAGLGLTVAGADRDAGNDPRLAGINFVGQATPTPFRLDLPAAGAYDVHLAIGDALGGTFQTVITVKDNTTTLFTVTQVSTTANVFTDANGNEWSAAAWPGSETGKTVTFASTVAIFEVTALPPGSAFGGLAFFGVTPVVVASGWGPLLGLQRDRLVRPS